MRENDKRPLTLKQKAFAEYYAGECNGNACQSAIKAGYSKKTALEQGCQTLIKLNVKDYINELLAKKAKERVYNKVTAEQLLYDLMERCKADNDKSTEIATIRELNTINALRTENVNSYVQDNTPVPAVEEAHVTSEQRRAMLKKIG